MKDQYKSGLEAGKYYIGKVVATNDPDQVGRVRVRPEGEYFDAIPDNHLPWARVAPDHPGGMTADFGRFAVPEVGSTVCVEYLGGNPFKPVYWPAPIDTPNMLEEAKINYPKRKVSLFPSGTLVIVDDETKEIFVRCPDTYNMLVVGDLNLQVNGNVNQRIKGNRLTVVDGDDTEVIKGKKTVIVTGDHVEATQSARKLFSSSDTIIKAGGSLKEAAGSNIESHAGGDTLAGGGGIFHDNAPIGPAGDSAPSAPADPSGPPWPGVRGDKPEGS